MSRLFTIALIGLALLLGCKHKTQPLSDTAQSEPRGADNLAYRWAKVALAATANNTDLFKPRPTITSRYMALIHTAVFDAWSRYDEKAKPVYLRRVGRRPVEEQTLKNKEVAISYAYYRAMSEYYYTDTTMFKDFMVSLGLDPNDKSVDPVTPVGIGNLAAWAVIEARKKDGSNQYGDEGASNGEPYLDYTNYKPVNTADKNVDINRWQPKYFSDGKGGKYAPECLTPFWPKVKPMALKSGDQFRPPPPPMVGSEQLEKEVKEVVEMQANITNEQKALVEFMRDGPRSVQQAGHWLIFAQQISVRDSHNLDQDVKMYFLNQITAMDAFIAAWDAKMYYDYARPYALVHHYYKDKKIRCWASPEEGMTEKNGQEWRPYSPETFLCPAFPAYVSGHSCVSGACSKALELFTGSDAFGEEVKLVPGVMTELPENFGDTITLKFETLSGTAEMAGISRVLGGYHIQADNIAGLELGRNVAQEAWKMYQMHVNGGEEGEGESR